MSGVEAKELEVIAIGGHALNDKAFEALAYYLRENVNYVLTHGNGPQVETKSGETLHAAVSGTQTSIGTFTIRPKLGEALERLGRREKFGEIEMIETDVVVGEAHLPVPMGRVIRNDDPAAAFYVKRIGDWMSEEEVMAEACEGQYFKRIKEARDPGRSYLRVVPSLRPMKIVQAEEIKQTALAGKIPIGVGGGGVPYYDENKTSPAQTVVDKDLASAVLAAEIEATKLTILTKVAGLIKPGAAWKLTAEGWDIEEDDYIREITVSEARAMLNDLPAGSMRPKLLACILFVESGVGREAVITNAENLNGGMRTLVVPGRVEDVVPLTLGGIETTYRYGEKPEEGVA
jgi:carbamate kinase